MSRVSPPLVPIFGLPVFISSQLCVIFSSPVSVLLVTPQYSPCLMSGIVCLHPTLPVLTPGLLYVFHVLLNPLFEVSPCLLAPCSPEGLTEYRTQNRKKRRCSTLVFVFSVFEKFFVSSCFSCSRGDGSRRPLHRPCPPRSPAATALDDATILSLFWHGANSHRPVDLPDTKGLCWREGILRCLESVRARARTSLPSSAAPPSPPTRPAAPPCLPAKNMASPICLYPHKFSPVPASPGPVPPEPLLVPSSSPEPLLVPSSSPEPLLVPPSSPEPLLVPSSSPEPLLVPSSSPEPLLVPSSSQEPLLVPPSSPELLLVPSSSPEPLLVPPSSPEPLLVPSSSPEPLLVPSSSPEPLLVPSSSQERPQAAAPRKCPPVPAPCKCPPVHTPEPAPRQRTTEPTPRQRTPEPAPRQRILVPTPSEHPQVPAPAERPQESMPPVHPQVPDGAPIFPKEILGRGRVLSDLCSPCHVFPLLSCPYLVFLSSLVSSCV